MSNIDALVLLLLYIVDEVLNGVLIFCSVRWTLLGEYSFFGLCDISLESWFIQVVEVPIPVPSLTPAGASPSLLIHLGCVPHGGVITLFFNNVDMNAFPWLLTVEE